jgi:hypothetical protein
MSEEPVTPAAAAGASSCVVIGADGSPCTTVALVGRYCPDHEPVLLRDLEIFRQLHEHFMQDTREFWRRSNFYLVVNAALVLVFASGQQTPLRLVLAVFGLLTSAFWLFVAPRQHQLAAPLAQRADGAAHLAADRTGQIMR